MLFFQKRVNIRAVEDLLKLKPIDDLFISSFKEMTKDEKIIKIKELIANSQFDYIVKMVYINPDFKEICCDPKFSDDWIQLWSTYGVIITGDESKALCDQITGNKLNLFLGMYFYERAVHYQKIINDPLSPIVLNYLKEGIKCRSIHACQQYHQYIYRCIDEDEPLLDEESAISALTNTIKTIKGLLDSYTSYAYLMLAEAYVRYGLYLKKEGTDHSLILRAEQSAISSCEQAIRLYQEDDPSIFNASFGEGLKKSNTLSITVPSEAIALIQACFASSSRGATPSN